MLPLPLEIAKRVIVGILSRPRITLAFLIIATCAIIYIFRTPIIVDDKLTGYKFSKALNIICIILVGTSLALLGASNIYTKCHLESDLCDIAATQCESEESEDEDEEIDE